MELQSRAEEPAPNVAAVIYQDPKGNSFRILSGRGSRKVISRYPSVKSRRAMPCEADHEEMLVYISEADFNVVSYLTQPHRLEMYSSNGARPRVYFPDMMRQMRDGTTEIIETKKNKSEYLHKPEYAEKLAWARECYARLGYVFRVMTAEDDLNIKPLLPNAKMIALDNKTRWTTADLFRLREAYAASCTTRLPYEAAIRSMVTDFRDSTDATAILHAMIVRGIAGIAIDRPIVADSPVHLLEEFE